MRVALVIKSCEVVTPLDGAGVRTWESICAGRRGGRGRAVREVRMEGAGGLDRWIGMAVGVGRVVGCVWGGVGVGGGGGGGGGWGGGGGGGGGGVGGGGGGGGGMGRATGGGRPGVVYLEETWSGADGTGLIAIDPGTAGL